MNSIQFHGARIFPKIGPSLVRDRYAGIPMQAAYTKEIRKDLATALSEEPGATMVTATAAQTSIVRISRTSIWRRLRRGAGALLDMTVPIMTWRGSRRTRLVSDLACPFQARPWLHRNG